MLFSGVTKNLNWKISTKNLVAFKRWDGVKDGKFKYYEGSLKNTINQYIGGNCLKREGPWTVCRFNGGGSLAKKGGEVFLRGWWLILHAYNIGPVTKFDKKNKTRSKKLTRRHVGKLWRHCHFSILRLIWSNPEARFRTHSL